MEEQRLTAIQSPTGLAVLNMQAADGNLVLRDAKTSAVLWATMTTGPGDHTVLQTDGNLVVYGEQNSAMCEFLCESVEFLLMQNVF